MTPSTCWSTESFRRHGRLVLELLGEFIESSRTGGGPVVRLAAVDQLLAELGIDEQLGNSPIAEDQLDCFLRSFLDGATRLQHPAYMAHQIAVPHYASALADLISGAVNNGMSVYEMGPTATAIEVAVIDWLLAQVGWQPSGRNASQPPAPGTLAGGGVLTHGGSLANLTALLAARAAAVPDAWERGTPANLVVLAPPSAHYSLSRAVAIMGMGTGALVAAPADRLGRLQPDALPAVHDRLQAEGRRVMAVCANACATATGLYDPLAEVGAFCQDRKLWFHVDGAHGASALLSPRERQRLRGVELADSLTWDAHKLLQTSALCAAVLLRDRQHLHQAFQQQAVYVTEGARTIGLDVIPHQFECTKAPLGLKLFLTIAMVGRQGLAENVERLWQLARRARAQIAARPGFDVLCPPESNILCFRRLGDDTLQSRLRDELMTRGDFLISQADVDGRRWLRLTLMNPLTDETTITGLLDAIEALGDHPAKTGGDRSS